jgi:DNA polymerase II large subunit
MTVAGQEMKSYFMELERQIGEIYEIAKKARSLGYDPELELEIPRAEDLAARVEKLVGPPGVAEVIRGLEKEVPREELSLKIAEMIVDGHFGRFQEQQAAEQAVRTALAIITEGVAAAAPLEGITHVEIRKNFDGSPYLALYFAGPIRSAGGTAAALAVLTGDFVRRKLHLGPYKPTDNEVERFVEEVELYATDVTHLQYTPPSFDDIRAAVRNIPVEITGEPTEREVSVTSYRDLERIGHNLVRGGAVLALVEGVLQKAPKIMKHVSKLNIDGWGWLSESMAKAPTKEEAALAYPKGEKYLDEVIAGRPVFSHPNREGGFRLRYGRARNTGIAAVGVHPAAMTICNDFIAVGTQLKMERPGKGGAVVPVDSIEGPIVKLDDSSVVQVNSVEQALELRNRVSEILTLGDILIGFGEFLENNHPLMPAGYSEEWWAQEVERALAGKKFGVELTPYLSPPYLKPAPSLAVELSEKLMVPLHPAYTYLFHDISIEELRELGSWLAGGEPEFEDGKLKGLRLILDQAPKRILEVLGVPHEVEDGRAVIEDHALPLCRCLGLLDGRRLTGERLEETLRVNPAKDIMEIVQVLAGFPVRQKAPTRVGCRMGRPEKANPRLMKPPVHVLFPVSLRGGATRSVVKAAESKEIYVDVARLKCPKCGTVGFTRKCPGCGEVVNYTGACPRCERLMNEERCLACNVRTEYFDKRRIELKPLFDGALQRLQEGAPSEVKGVRGMTSAYKIPEPIEKGILRAKHHVYVFKDGTVRFDATDVPLTHFRPREVGTSVERLRELGYERDCDGKPLKRDDQLVELKVQDIVLSNACAEYLLRTSKFVDDLLQKFYGLKPHYNANRPADLVGHMIIGLAPHTSVGIAGRIIGFTSASVGYAHPFFHAAKRRDCDGDEDTVILLLDALLNFSKRFLPSKRGGMMDAPLVLNTRIDLREIDKEAHNMDVMERYPLEFYEATLRYVGPSELAQLMETVERRLGGGAQYTGLKFSFDTGDIAAGPRASRYKTLETMEEKTSAQLGLARKIRAVDERDVAERLIEHHFIPDLKGNLRAFASQKFRCAGCNSKYRRVPLRGRCTQCGGNLILTVTRGGVEKYLQVAMQIAHDYEASDYTKQRLKLVQRDIKSVFESDAHRQLSLADFM